MISSPCLRRQRSNPAICTSEILYFVFGCTGRLGSRARLNTDMGGSNCQRGSAATVKEMPVSTWTVAVLHQHIACETSNG